MYICICICMHVCISVYIFIFIFVCISLGPDGVNLCLTPGSVLNTSDINVFYHVWTPQISATAICQPPSSSSSSSSSSIPDPGAFAVIVSPPAMGSGSGTIARNVVFLLDHSGSMGGDPMAMAREGLVSALGYLNPMVSSCIYIFIFICCFYSIIFINSCMRMCMCMCMYEYRINSISAHLMIYLFGLPMQIL